ncbi:LacI family transcriptional regulator [Arthrobacter sp. MYb224]|uniref:LacI family DNA-binding transcriptional regulator n=1 Tax=Micrococcaceae TaxID=1268 RepID=UPI000CFA8D45|nr:MULTISPECIES: LacI family DNA-binding transcriptional regulator [unclassified Arthrobacter]PRA00516.1 LacI family transcriptional regulator [Arthrobacter sp. MYb224]PRA04709.1 LacI family transcriptional regulator [Arthrobacter sp. MYb229]PRB51377.1 LacI family transcriptional regulator [Arthrobacter sp. MYb216]
MSKQGSLSAMNAVTIKDVASAAGVSVATASRVLSGHPATSPASRSKVEAAASELGFMPNAQARSLRSTKTDSIALLISDVRNPYFSDLAHSVEQHARAAGLMTFMGNANEDSTQQDDFLATMLSRRVDGLIIVPQGLDEEADAPSLMMHRVLSSGIPTVFVDRALRGSSVPAITTDSTEAVHQAVATLKDLGHTKIAFIGGPKHASTALERYSSFKSALAANGLQHDEALHFVGDFKPASGAEAARWLLNHGAKPSAVIIADAPMAIGALTVWREAGLRVGAELSVITFDEVDAMLLHDPPIATISHDLGLMGKLAVASLTAVMQGENPAPHELQSKFTARASVAAQATPVMEGKPRP